MPAPSKFPIGEVVLDEAADRFLATKKPSTEKSYRLCMKRFTYFYQKPAAEFIREIEQQTEANKGLSLAERIRPGEQVIRDFIAWHREQGYAPKTIRQGVAVVQNFLKYYGITLSCEFIDLPPAHPLRDNDKHEWTLDQVRRLVDSLPYLRDKAIALMMFQSGLGLSDIIKLRYRDIQREYEAGVTPLAIEGYRQKTGVRIRTFVGRDAARYLRLYLSSREPLRKDDPLFTLLGGVKPVTGASVCKQFREAAAKLDFILDEDLDSGYNPGRPHSLRAAFRSRLTGKVSDDLIETMMAHDIGQSRSTYMMQPLGEVRELYANFEHLLAVERTSKEEAASGAVPEAAMKVVREQGQKLAELEVKLEEAKTALGERDRRMDTMEQDLSILKRALANPEAAPILLRALQELEEKARQPS